LYKGKKPEAAQKVFDGAAESAKDAPGKSRAVYNKGVTLTRQNKLQESVDAYKQSLRLVPTDEEARQNLQKALNELKKQQQQQKQQQPKQDKKSQNQQKPNEQPQNKSKLNQKQAEQMLSALRQEEKKLQQGIQKKNNTGGANSKDW
jgi:Ca-activated chloride channel family protein